MEHRHFTVNERLGLQFFPKKVETDVGPSGQQDYQFELDDEKLTVVSDHPAVLHTMPERNYDGFTVTTFRSHLRNRNLCPEDTKPTLVARLKETDSSEVAAGHSSMLQNIPPDQLDVTTSSSTAVGGSANEEPTTVATTGSLSEVADADTT